MVYFEHPNASGLPIGVFQKEKLKSGKDAHFTYCFVPVSGLKCFMFYGSLSHAFVYRQDEPGIQKMKYHIP